ncbi:MAG: glycosyltransferase family 4 protein [Patescibacteria group bacterium]
MKILFTVEFYEPHKGGAEEVVKQLAQRLVSRGHQVTVATTFLTGRRTTLLNGVHIREFRLSGNLIRGINGGAGEIKRYRDFLVRSDFDVIVNYAAQSWTTDLAFGVLDEVAAKKILVPCGYSALKDRRYADYFRKLPDYLGKYARLVYMSPSYQDKRFGDQHGLGDKAVIIPNGAAAEEFLAADTFAIREKLGVKTKYLLITVANHYVLKGHAFVRRAFAAMKRQDATLLIIGEPLVSYGWRTWKHFFLDYLPCFASSAIHSRLKLVNGKQRDVVLSAYKSADLFLFGSKLECAPLVMYESFAAGLPFITTDVGNVRDHQDVVKIVKSPGEMAVVANDLLDNPEESRKLAERAKQLWRKKHTWEEIAAQYEDLCASLLSDRT